MIYVGIDIAKDYHECHVINENKEVLLDFLKFSNNLSGFDELKYKLLDFSNNDVGQIVIGLEYTGHYSNSLIDYLYNHGFSIYPMHPLTVNRFVKTKTLRNTKTDKSDSRLIAELMINYEGEMYNPQSRIINELKTLCRARYNLMKNLKNTKLRYRKVLQIVFPELEKILDVNVETTFKILSRYSSPQDFLTENKKNYLEFLSPFYHGKFKEKANLILEKAQQSVGCGNKQDSYELKLLCDEILFFLNKKRELEFKIKNIMDELDSKILTIPGIGYISGAVILSEIGNINNFSSPEKILAYAGCEPSIYQSGKYVAIKTPIAKKGSVYLRSALYQVTVCSQFSNPYMKDYIIKKMTEGKHYYNAIMHGVKKMVRIIYTVLKNDIEFHY